MLQELTRNTNTPYQDEGSASPKMSRVSADRAAVKQTAEAERQMEGLRRVIKKMTQIDLFRVFNEFVQILTARRANRVKVERVLRMLQNRHLAHAFQGYVNGVDDSQAQKETALLAMRHWMSPGLQKSVRSLDLLH